LSLARAKREKENETKAGNGSCLALTAAKFPSAEIKRWVNFDGLAMRGVVMRLECEKFYGMTNMVLAPVLAYHKALSILNVIQCCSDAVEGSEKASKDQ
jgi:hypothetical protein